jgi:ABC-type phosphate transport system permease subunit
MVVMDVETKKLLLQYLEAGADRLERGAAFVESEIPLVVTEYLSWHWWNSLLGLVLFLIMCVVAAFLGMACHYSAKQWEKTNHHQDSGWIAAMVFSFIGSLILGLVGSCVSVGYAKDLVKVSVAPRVVILEKIAEVAK